jgi:putative Mg2+ transporter-C (MgtC) family protein
LALRPCGRRALLFPAKVQRMYVSNTEQLHIVFRLVVAGGLGAFIGLEREVRGYPAGIRTIALVSVGACLFTDVSVLFVASDQSRVAAQIVSGIGFLGAGVILREGYSIRGITTAATIWAAAAVGMATGLSLYVVAVLGATFIFMVLEARPLTRRINDRLHHVATELHENDTNEVRTDE